MTDDRRTAPLAGFADAFAAAASDAVRLVERPFLAQVGVRVFGARSGLPGPAGLSAAEAALGFPLPAEPNTVAGAGGTDVLWLGRQREAERGLRGGQPRGIRDAAAGAEDADADLREERPLDEPDGVGRRVGERVGEARERCGAAVIRHGARPPGRPARCP